VASRAVPLQPEDAWSDLVPGAQLTIVKLMPEGQEAARYPGEVIEAGAAAPWIAVRAIWTFREYNLDGLRFCKGDTLHEFFSPEHPFNVFSVYAPDGTLRGWYANVTYPARLDPTTAPPTLYWHDLYIDVVALPDGSVAVRDEDELEDARLAERDPDVYRMITGARDELLRLVAARAVPFHER